MPRFGETTLTRPGDKVCAELNVLPPDQPPLPALIEPTSAPLVTNPVSEPLVKIAHPRITTLENYRLAGWAHASSGTWLRQSVFARLTRAVESLPHRWGMCVFDAWRPLELQAALYKAAYKDRTLQLGFVSTPDQSPHSPPPHLTGGAIDCSLTLDGIPFSLGSEFDDFYGPAHAAAFESEAGVNQKLRRWLYWTMHHAGFVILDTEWWHFEYGTRRWAGITGAEPLFGPAAPSNGP